MSVLGRPEDTRLWVSLRSGKALLEFQTRRSFGNYIKAQETNSLETDYTEHQHKKVSRPELHRLSFNADPRSARTLFRDMAQ